MNEAFQGPRFGQRSAVCRGDWFVPAHQLMAGLGYPLDIRLGDDPAVEYVELRAEALAWRNQRWWVTGTLDGRPTGQDQLSLASIHEIY